MSDEQIKAKAVEKIIQPGVPGQVSSCSGGKLISYGLGSAGYDIRLSIADFRVCQPLERGWVVDPKNIGRVYEQIEVSSDANGVFFVIPAQGYALGVSMEEFNMPSNVLGICLGKSTYARSGIVLNTTPLEPGWKGFLTLEFFNGSPNPVRLYAGEGVAQVLFFQAEGVGVSYADRAGKYQGQKQEVVLPRLK
jgi:dCTP deaminase